MSGRRGIALPLGLGALVLAALLALGTWQVQRRIWKLDLIDQVDRQAHAPPILAPGPLDWPRIGGRDAYRHVRTRGHFLHDRETLVQALTENGSGYWVLTPLRSEQGFTVLVNRGFVPDDHARPAQRASGQVLGPVTVTGLLRVSEPRGRLLRSNDPGADRWYSRDVAAIAGTRHLGSVAPYFIDADATPNPGGLPLGGLTVIAFPNNHLIYAITWYGLALLTGWAMLRLVRMRR